SIKPEMILKDIDKVTLFYEEPFYSLSTNYLISKAVSEHGIKVILNGLGGDELFGGYQSFKIAQHHGYFKLLYPFLRASTLLYPSLCRALDIKNIKSLGDLQGA